MKKNSDAREGLDDDFLRLPGYIENSQQSTETYHAGIICKLQFNFYWSID